MTILSITTNTTQKYIKNLTVSYVILYGHLLSASRSKAIKRLIQPI